MVGNQMGGLLILVAPPPEGGVSDSNRLHPTGDWWEVTEWRRGELAIQGKVEVARAIQRYLGREGEDLIPFARSFVGELGEKTLYFFEIKVFKLPWGGWQRRKEVDLWRH